jgi:hypothetical protein
MTKLDELKEAAETLAPLVPITLHHHGVGTLGDERKAVYWATDMPRGTDSQVVRKAVCLALNALAKLLAERGKLLAVVEAAKDVVASHAAVCAGCGVGKCDLCYALNALEEGR